MRNYKSPITSIAILSILILATSLDSSSAAGDWDGPKVVSVAVSPSTIDVSNNASYVNIEVHATDATGVKSVTLQFRTGVGGVGGGQDVTLSKCANSVTDCVMNGKLVFSKRYRPGIYSLPSIIMTDTAGNGSHDSSNTTITVINTAGNPDPNEVSILPPGIKVEDYLPERVVTTYQSTLDSLNALNSEISNATKEANMLGLAIPNFQTPPANQISLSGDMFNDMDAITAFSSKVQQFRDSVISQLKQFEIRISQAKNKSATKTITCSKGKVVKKVTAAKPVCPTGFKQSGK